MQDNVVMLPIVNYLEKVREMNSWEYIVFVVRSQIKEWRVSSLAKKCASKNGVKKEQKNLYAYSERK